MDDCSGIRQVWPGTVVVTVGRASVVDQQRCLLGESPRWDDNLGVLMWVDVLGGCLLERSFPGPGGPTSPLGLQGRSGPARPAGRRSRQVGAPLGAVVPRAPGGYVVAQERSLLLLDAELRLDAVLVDQVPGDGRGYRINECAVDPGGRLLVGTTTSSQEEGAAACWRLERDGTLRTVVREVTVSNGMDWSPDGATMYYVDSPSRAVVQMDYDEDPGPARPFAELADSGGVPDGLCVDADGDVWVAVAHGAQVRRYHPDGREVERVELPVGFVTSCTLALAPDPVLFVTTAAVGRSEDDLVDEPLAGSLLRVAVDASPAPVRRYPG